MSAPGRPAAAVLVDHGDDDVLDSVRSGRAARIARAAAALPFQATTALSGTSWVTP